MSARNVILLNHQYNERIGTLMRNLPEHVVPQVDRIVMMAARDLYQDMLNLEDRLNIDYIKWLEAITKFYKYPALLELDPDGTLEKLANRILNAPGLMEFFKKNVDTGVELDGVQLALFVKQANAILSLG